MARYRKIIQSTQKNEVVCDNLNCDFVVPNERKDAELDSKRFINVACPKCGENLLTQQDYDQYLIVLRYVNFINKWFSWLTIFISESTEPQIIETHVHNGVKISKK